MSRRQSSAIDRRSMLGVVPKTLPRGFRRTAKLFRMPSRILEGTPECRLKCGDTTKLPRERCRDFCLYTYRADWFASDRRSLCSSNRAKDRPA